MTRLQRFAGLGDDAEWTHVGVYDGQGRIWDAVPGSGVRTRAIQDVFGTNSWVRRRRFPDLKAESGSVLRELTLFGEARYDFWPLRSRFLKRLERDNRIAEWDARLTVPESDYESVVCSTFVALVLRRFCDAPALYRTPLTLPADFLDPAISEVPITVREVMFD